MAKLWAHINRDGEITSEGSCSEEDLQFQIPREGEFLIERPNEQINYCSGHKFINGEWINES